MSDEARLAPDLHLSVRELVRTPGASRQGRYWLVLDEHLGTDVIGLPAGGRVDLDVLCESVLEGVLVTGTVTAQAQGECVRCLEEVHLPVDVTFQELYVYPERSAAAVQAGDSEDGLALVVDDVVDLATPVRDAIVLALPFQPLCREDCPGLCPECGVQLAGQAGHHHDTVDPRWSALEEVLQNRDEGS
jgi:uncharacterized protein